MDSPAKEELENPRGPAELEQVRRASKKTPRMKKMPFNVMEHTLVPNHRLLSNEETRKVLSSLKISKDQLPKIKINDPCVKILETPKRPVKEGMVVEVTRTSETAGQSKAYRLVVRR